MFVYTVHQLSSRWAGYQNLDNDNRHVLEPEDRRDAGRTEGKARDTDFSQPSLTEGIPRSLELRLLWICQGLPVRFVQNWHEI